MKSILTRSTGILIGLFLHAGCGTAAPPDDDLVEAQAKPGSDEGGEIISYDGDFHSPEVTLCKVDEQFGVCKDVGDCGGAYMPVPGHCPGPASFQCCVLRPPGVCDPEGGAPNKGITGEAAGLGGCPSGMIRIDDFCVDRYEASLLDAETGKSFSPYINPGMRSVRAVSVAGAVPQAYISGEQAAEACAVAGKRLCTNEEWLRACQGPEGLTYPYGNKLESGVCNDHRALHPVVEYYGTNADWIWSELDNACIDQLPDSLDRAGENEGCMTAEGLFDMMGNLHEWTSDPEGTFRGGFYVDTYKNGPGCLYATKAHTATYWDYSTGFRCCF